MFKNMAPTRHRYWKLYSFMDPLDYMLVLVGTVSALAAGTALPLVSIVMGDMMDVLGPGTSSPTYRSDINQIILYYVYLGLFAMLTNYLHMSCWMLTATRQANRVREHYLRAVLAQEIGFFDLESTSGGLLQGLNEVGCLWKAGVCSTWCINDAVSIQDTVAVQDAIGHKVGNFLQNVSLCVSGLIIGTCCSV